MFSSSGNIVPQHKTVLSSYDAPVHVDGYGRSLPESVLLTFFESDQIVAKYVIPTTQDLILSFGSADDNDVVVSPPSQTVSRHHGIIRVGGGQMWIEDRDSTNGLYIMDRREQLIHASLGDVIAIGKLERGEARTIIMVSDGASGDRWSIFDLVGRNKVSIGRASDNDLVISTPSVSARHSLLSRGTDGTWYISDTRSSNGTRVNESFVFADYPLNPGSLITLGNAHVVFMDRCLLVMTERRGVDVVASDLVRRRVNRGKTRITTDHVSLHIHRGEFVAIVGGSGCGKSTLLNELNGGEPADEGHVYVDGTDLYDNYELLKTSIGYVPQQDIVYDDLRVSDMLLSAAKLRMQPDTTPQEHVARVEEVIELLELDGVRDNFIRNLSGGQKKRVSIAVELLADPRLLFLDEPTSGLDPGIERKLMMSLAEMAHAGRTIILVTHTTLNLHLCDQVVFLGVDAEAGGKLCFAGPPKEAMEFFGVDDFVDAYNVMEKDSELLRHKFAREHPRSVRQSSVAPTGKPALGRSVPSTWSQFCTLSARYVRLILNDRARLALLLLQAPILAFLITLTAGSECFVVFESTKSCLFALSCAAFWVGIFDSIQEVCKEGSIFHREYEGGLRLRSYLLSKVAVMGVICFIQSSLLILVFCLQKNNLPTDTFLPAPIELLISIFLTMLSAMCLGLLISAIFKNPDRALATAPLLIMPQLLLAGVVFELSGVTEIISYAVNCRWAMEALGTTANLNDLDLKIYGEEITIPEGTEVLESQEIEVPESTVEVDTGFGTQEVTVPAETRTFENLEVNIPETQKTIDGDMFEHEADAMFDHSVLHLLTTWGVLVGFSVICVIGCRIKLSMSVRR